MSVLNHNTNVINERNSRVALWAHVVDAHPVEGGVGRLNGDILNGKSSSGDGVGADEPLTDEEAVVVAATVNGLPVGNLIVGNLLGVIHIGPVVPDIHHIRLINTIGDRVVWHIALKVALVKKEEDASIAAVLVHEVLGRLFVELSVGVQVTATVVDALELAKEVVDLFRIPEDWTAHGSFANTDHIAHTEEDDLTGVLSKEMVDLVDNVVKGFARVANGDVAALIVDMESPIGIVRSVVVLVDRADSKVKKSGAGAELVVEVDTLGLRVRRAADAVDLAADSAHSRIVCTRHVQVLDLAVFDNVVNTFHPVGSRMAQRSLESILRASSNDQCNRAFLSWVKVFPLAEVHVAQIEDRATWVVVGNVVGLADLETLVGSINFVVNFAIVVNAILSSFRRVSSNVLT